MFCPNFNIEEVFNGFNEIIEALGGRAMTEDEFKSSALRNQRTGLDYSAMEAAYKLYHRNNGNMLDLAPNGEKSILFQTLLDRFHGNRLLAIKAKSNVYSDNFINWFGDWINDPTNASKVVDENGEPLDDNIYKLESQIDSKTTSTSKFNISIDLPSTGAQLSSGESVSSNDVIQDCLNSKHLTHFQREVLELLQVLNIPIKLSKSMPINDIAQTAYTSDGRAIVELNSKTLEIIPKSEVYHAIIHELLHAKTVNSIKNPVTKQELEFSNTTKYVYFQFTSKLIDQLGVLPELPFSVRYAMTNEREFAAEFMSNDYVRSELFAIARIMDNNRRGRFVNSLIRLINKASDAFFHRTAFNTTESQLQNYKNRFKQYLLNTKEYSQQKISKKDLDRLYSQLDQSSVDAINTIDDAEVIQKANFFTEIDKLSINPTEVVERFKNRKYSMQSIVDDLTLRLSSIYTRDIDAATKSNAIDYTKQQIAAFSGSQTPQYVAISSLIQFIDTKLFEDVKRLAEAVNNNQQVITPSELQFLSRDTFDVYGGILNRLAQQLEISSQKQRLIDEYNTSGLFNDSLSADDIERLKKSIEESGKIIQRGKNLSSNLTQFYGIKYLSEVGEEVKSPTIQQHIEDYALDNTFEDTSWLWLWIGSAEMSENETVRAITHIISKINKEAEAESKKVVYEGLGLLQNLRSGEKMTDLYEEDSDGFTGYLTRDLNFGRFYKEYDKALVKINKKLGLPLDNRIAPADENLRIKFNQMRNKWLKENCHRKYLNEYYEAWDNVPTFVKERIQIYNRQIDDILSRNNVRNEDGFADYSLLPEEEYDLLRSIIVSKRALYSKWDEYGNEKKPGDPNYDVYIALNELNEKLDALQIKVSGKPKQTQISYATAQWKKAREAVIQRAGGIDEYNKYIAGEENNFNYQMLDNWDLYNSRIDFKRDAISGEAIVYKEISETLGELDKQIDYGPEYDKINEEINSILSIFRNEMGEVDLQQIPDSTRIKLTDKNNGLLAQRYKIRKEVLARNATYRNISKLKQRLIQQYLLNVDTERFKILKSSISKKFANLIEETGDVTAYDEAYFSELSRWGDVYYGEGGFPTLKPYSFTQKQEARDYKKYMVLTPNYNWIERTRDQFLNPKWEGEKYEASMIPLREKYDNTAQYKKIQNSPSLLALYKYAYRTIKTSNEYQTNRQFVDNYLLPQIASSKMDQVLNAPWAKKFQTFVRIVLETLGFQTDLPVSDIEDIGTDAALDRPDVRNVDVDPDNNPSNETEVLPEKPRSARRKLLLRYSSTEEEYHILPQYYTRKLVDPNVIDRNLIHLLSNYYLRSLQYKKRTEIKDKCEILLDLLASKMGRKSNHYSEARGQMNRRLYDERRSVKSVKTDNPLSFEFSQAASNLRNLTTAVNLGAKPSIAITAVFSTMYKFLESALGSGDYSLKDWANSHISLFKDIILKGWKIPFSVSTTNTNKTTSSFRTALASYYGLAEQYENAYKHLERNWITRTILDHSIFGMMTMSDYVTKTTIGEGILRAYRFVDGEFITRQKIEDRRVSYGEELYKSKIKAYKKAKSLYSLYKNNYHNDGIVEIPQQYKEAEKEIFTVVQADIQNTGQLMDGLPTAEQRTMASTNAIGMLFFIHRNYLSVLAQKYWRSAVYSYETERYINAIHRQSVGLVAEILKNQAVLGSLITGIGGLAIGGPLGGIIGFTGGVGYSIYQNKKNERLGIDYKKKSIKKTLSDYYKTDLSNESSYVLSLHKQRSIKQISTELLLHYLIFDLLLNGLFFPFADDDDHKDSLLIQLIAYCLRKAELETFNQYRLSDLLSTLKSASAAQSLTDKAEGFYNSIATTLFPNGDLISNLGLWDAIKTQDQNNRIQKGPYQGWNKAVRNIWRLIPYSNFYHETSNKVNILHPDWGGESVRSTRKRYENTVLHIEGKKKSKSKK